MSRTGVARRPATLPASGFSAPHPNVKSRVQRWRDSLSPSSKRFAAPIALRCILPQVFSILSDQPERQQLRYDAITLAGAHFMT